MVRGVSGGGEWTLQTLMGGLSQYMEAELGGGLNTVEKNM